MIRCMNREGAKDAKRNRGFNTEYTEKKLKKENSLRALCPLC